MISNDTKAVKFAITHTKLYVLIVTLSTRDNAKLLQQIKSGFKSTTNCNKYQSNINQKYQYKLQTYIYIS